MRIEFISLVHTSIPRRLTQTRTSGTVLIPPARLARVTAATTDSDYKAPVLTDITEGDLTTEPAIDRLRVVNFIKAYVAQTGREVFTTKDIVDFIVSKNPTMDHSYLMACISRKMLRAVKWHECRRVGGREFTLAPENETDNQSFY